MRSEGYSRWVKWKPTVWKLTADAALLIVGAGIMYLAWVA